MAKVYQERRITPRGVRTGHGPRAPGTAKEIQKRRSPARRRNLDQLERGKVLLDRSLETRLDSSAVSMRKELAKEDFSRLEGTKLG